MKVLSMAWTIYDDKMKEFCNNYTGGGLVIKNICEYIGRKEDSFLFIGKCHLAEQKIGNINFVATDYKISDNDSDAVKDESYLANMTKKFEIALEKINPDIVNFHGIGELMQRCIAICIKKRVPYVYTEHLFISKEKDFEGYDSNVALEEQLYHIPDLKIIAVSSGVKIKILKDFPFIQEENIRVIKNGTDFIPDFKNGMVHTEYNLEGKKVLLCVGTIVNRKNQLQVVRAYQLLPPDIRQKVKILFCGKDNMDGMLQNKICEAGLKGKLIYVGAISSEMMKEFYSEADGLIMPSFAEGLSIAALEGMAYGLPVIMFSDSECAQDLNDENIVSFAKERSDLCLAKAIEEWYQKEWDRKYIVEYSRSFSMEQMADNYIKYYREQIINS